jgi:hypothetical protein
VWERASARAPTSPVWRPQSIAQKHRTTVEGLQALNRLAAGSVLHAGATVVVQRRGGPSQQRASPLLFNAAVKRVQVQVRSHRSWVAPG